MTPDIDAMLAQPRPALAWAEVEAIARSRDRGALMRIRAAVPGLGRAWISLLDRRVADLHRELNGQPAHAAGIGDIRSLARRLSGRR